METQQNSPAPTQSIVISTEDGTQFSDKSVFIGGQNLKLTADKLQREVAQPFYILIIT
ncbi:protein of unknown function [Xenorhabdus poinarii G6]|uniref:Uncharacterized protein n=1 Tax=Xenorhabdus poinarii G6 TaxID=1354304 RepID=A0A068R0B5_9GAMM|nr:hypothetical protein [Xenorhabdus poinarii]CDG20494.1 protein of unknown function [Xenorhabdus poinarii G6]